MEPQLINLAANAGLGVVMTIGFGVFLRIVVLRLLDDSRDDRKVMLEALKESTAGTVRTAAAIDNNTAALHELKTVVGEHGDAIEQLRRGHTRTSHG